VQFLKFSKPILKQLCSICGFHVLWLEALHYKCIQHKLLTGFHFQVSNMQAMKIVRHMKFNSTLILLRSEILTGMSAKLHTVAASNNRDHPTRSLYYCLFAPHIYSVFLHAHPVRGESHI